MRIVFASDLDANNFESVFMDQPCSHDSENKVWTTIREFVQCYLIEFSTTIEEDTELLNQSSLKYENRLAISVRREIKDILCYIKELCDEQLKNNKLS